MPTDPLKKKTPVQQRSAIEIEFQETLTFYESYVFPLYDKAWKQYLKDSEDRKIVGQLKSWESNVYSAITQKFVDVMFANYYDSEISFKVMGTDEKGKRNEEAMKLMMQDIIERTNVRTKLDSMAKDSFICGMGYVKSLWIEEEVKVKRMAKGVAKELTIRKTSMPSIKYASNYHVMAEPTAETFDTANYVYEMRFLNIDVASRAYLKYFQMKHGKAFTGEQFKALIKAKVGNKGVRDGILKRDDPDNIKIKILMTKAANVQKEWTSTVNQSNNRFNEGYVNTEAMDTFYRNNSYEFVERWSNEHLYLLCNGVEVLKIANPLPMKGHPFAAVRYSEITNTFFGVGIAYNVSEVQNIINSIWNLRIDAEKISGMPVFTRLRSPSMDIYQGNDEIDFTPGKIIPIREQGELQPLVRAKTDSSALLQSELLDLNNEAMQAIGVNEYSLGSQGKVERSAAGVKALVQSFKIRLRPFIVSFNAAMEKIAWTWFSMIVAWGDENITIVSENGIEEFPLEDIVAQYHFTFDAQSLFSTSRDLEKETLNQALPMLGEYAKKGPNGEPGVINPHKLMQAFTTWMELPKDIVNEEPQEQGPQAQGGGPIDLGLGGAEGADIEGGVEEAAASLAGVEVEEAPAEGGEPASEDLAAELSNLVNNAQ